MSQTNDLYNLLSDCEPHRTDEILRVVYGSDRLGLARIAARVNDILNLNKGYVFLDRNGTPLTEKGKRKGWKDPVNPKLWWYWMKPLKTQESSLGERFKKEYEERMAKQTIKQKMLL